MNQNEFLRRLREALENELSGQAVQENMRYYENYIKEEVRKGRREEDVVAELGDPWIIARSITDSPNVGKGYASNDTYVDENGQSFKQENRVHVFGLDTWWKKLLAMVVIAAVIAGIISIITGVLSLIMPILIPILLIVIVVRIFNKK